jgi:ketosteroid isomerase-like protein
MSDARTPNEQLVHDLFALENVGDFAGMTELMSEDVEFDLAYAPEFLTMPVRGRAAMLELMNMLMGGVFRKFTVEILATYQGADPEVIVVEYRSDAIVDRTGGPYRNRYVAIMRIRDGEVAFWREYHNPEEATRALGA